MSATIRMDNGDVEIGSAGEQYFVTGAEKAAQDVLDEILLPYDATRDRGNEMFGPDGSLSDAVNDDFMGPALVQSMLQSTVQRLMRAQAADSATDARERIQKLESVLVTAHPSDPTAYAFLISIIVNDERIGIARAIRMNHLAEALS